MTVKLKQEVEVLTEQLTKTQAQLAALSSKFQALSYIHVDREIELAVYKSKGNQ